MLNREGIDNSMRNTLRLNWILFILFLLITIGVLVASFILPQVRAVAYAPLRELIFPPPAPVVVDVLYSTEKAAWLSEVVVEFEKTDPRVNGRPIELNMEKMGSREIYLAVLDGDRQPTLISPASSLQISILEDLSASRYGEPFVNPKDSNSCRPVVTSPLVVAAWKERADALWGDDPNDLWTGFYEALTNPQGWGAYGHPDWGYVKFGHTNPLSSNSGFQTILLMTYDYHGKTSGLTSEDILADPGYQEWFLGFEGAISSFGESTGTYMEEIIAYGPSLYDMVAVYESVAIEQAENAAGKYGELKIYYPPATHLSDHPFCVLDADWVSPEQAEAAQLFVDFLTSREAQELALLKYGFRPVDPGIPLEQAGSPFLTYQENGIQAELAPEVELPAGSVLNTLLDFWTRNVQR